jgi:SAM-dependent methyltransferase
MSRNIRSTLEGEGYLPLSQSPVLASQSFEGIGYSDVADTEIDLLQTLTRSPDVSVLSEELMLECNDWVSTYHLSHTRANLLRPFRDTLRGTVLELGAGCGAVTRFLGETAKEVVAVEGSLRRCEINAERNRDANNVSIVASEISKFTTSAKFDSVVAVGVLKYAAIFNDSPEPHLEFLKKISTLLNPGGVVLLAIENKFGLKYLAGAPEDHIGIPMFGVEDKYTEKGVRTFSRFELFSKFVQSGFTSIYFHSPIPDYKTVRAVISDDGLESEQFLSGELASQLSKFDLQLPQYTSFDLTRSWIAAGEARLDSALSNSFLVEARVEVGWESALKDKLAFWYGTDRKPRFLKEKVFLQNHLTQEVTVHETLLQPQLFKNDASASFKQKLEPPSKYMNGKTYAELLADYVSRYDWSLEGLASQIAEYVDRCAIWARKNGYQWATTTENSLVIDGSLFDLLPKNVKADKGSFHPYDLEWRKTEDFDLYHFIFRICFDTLLSTKFTLPSTDEYKDTTLFDALEILIATLGLPKSQMDRGISMEADFHSLVGVRKLDSLGIRVLLSRKLVINSENEELQIALHTLQSSNHEIISRVSLIITKPLRQASRFLKGLTIKLRSFGKE